VVIAGNRVPFVTAQQCFKRRRARHSPKEMVLAKDSQSDSMEKVAFNHENHSTKKYSVDGQSVLTCVECHHTDQPAAGLKPPLKDQRAQRDTYGCGVASRRCESGENVPRLSPQAGDDSAPIPTSNILTSPLPQS